MDVRCWVRGLLGSILVGLCLSLNSGPVFAQGGQEATLTGRVVNAETGLPLPGAHVFLAQSMNGTVADSSGHYRLSKVPQGRANLVASRVGFQPGRRTIRIRRGESKRVELALRPDVIEMPEVVVEGDRDERWKKWMQRFRAHVLGTTKIAQSAKIMNPEVLRFQEEEEGVVRVRTAEPIRIEYAVLGYHIRYALGEFRASSDGARYKGEALYEPMSPQTEDERRRWEKYRKRAYEGSFMHFIRAASQDRCRDAGFQVMSVLRGPVRCEDVLSVRPGSRVAELHLGSGIAVVYEDGKESLLLPNSSTVLVDTRGQLFHPYSVLFKTGPMSQTGVADQLPLG